MTPAQARNELLTGLGVGEAELGSLTPAGGVAAMLAFYRDNRCEGCAVDADGDMLLFQWGHFDWGTGERFELDITRQFITSSEVEDEDIWQLALTFRYPPSSNFEPVGSSNRWCGDPAALAGFEAVLNSHPVFDFVAGLPPADTTLNFQAAR